jgi:hypothetical protein
VSWPVVAAWLTVGGAAAAACEVPAAACEVPAAEEEKSATGDANGVPEEVDVDPDGAAGKSLSERSPAPMRPAFRPLTS